MQKILLLLTILCASQLYGMEPTSLYELRRSGPEQKGNLGAFEQLPKELRQEIVKIALASSTTADQAIKTIQGSIMMYSGIQLNEAEAMNLINRLLPSNVIEATETVKHLQGNNLKDFIKLMALLADKFNYTPIGLFNSPIASEYRTLSKQLNAAVAMSNHTLTGYLIEFLIKYKGLIAGLNPQILFTAFDRTGSNKIEVIKALLAYGANPYGKNISKDRSDRKVGETFVQYINHMIELDPTNSELKTIQSLLDETIAKK